MDSLGAAWEILTDSVTILKRRPILLVPLLICWLFYAPVIVYMKFFFKSDGYTTAQIIGILFGILLFFSFLFTFSCFILLELIQQIETGEEISLYNAFLEVVQKDLLKSLPIMMVWAIIWTILMILAAIFSKKRHSEDDREDASAENVARTLAGDGSFSLSDAFFKALAKAVRMVVFMILPAIAWEDRGTWDSVKKGFLVLRRHLFKFAAGFLLSEGVAFLVFLPPGILFYISGKMNVHFPDAVWFGVIIYSAFAWSFVLFIEQMYCANLYMWYLVWERQSFEISKNGGVIPSLEDIKRPSLLDDYNDLNDTRHGVRKNVVCSNCKTLHKYVMAGSIKCTSCGREIIV